LRDEPADGALADLRDRLVRAAELAGEALGGLLEPAPLPQAAARILAALRTGCRALEALYPLRVLPPVGRFFAEPACHARLADLDRDEAGAGSVGFHRAGGGELEDRGGFTLYVPESWDGERALPLVVALHGAFGHGRDFVWTWLREARSRGLLLLAPTSKGTTWSLLGLDRDAAALRSMVEYVSGRWRVDASRVLLTGLSDGGTYALLCGLAEGSPFTHLAPVAGVLHPLNFANGNFGRAAGRPVYLVHGARDWMFPVALARAARDALAEAGADLVYRELADLSHTWPREENARILDWLGAPLAFD
jgi:phospholipase/carboxylesterase